MMTSSQLELSFDCKPQIYSMLSKYFGDHKTDQSYIQDFLSRLEEERVKIDAFKRELPLCMQLLTNAMEVSREELESQTTKQDQAGPVLEEFIPLKTPTYSSLATDNASNLSSDKANWMISAQLWNQDTDLNETHDDDIKFDFNAKQRINGVGAFLPFPSNDGNSSISAFPELALASSHKEETLETVSRRENSAGNCGNSKIYEKDTENTTQTQRKARRCWSPDLHRRFVNALHMLGGPQVATPKQIRELMKVDGLTNDEVKSHLQKYRLHTRSLCPSTQASVAPPPQLVVLGGIWVPPEYAAHGGAPASAFYGANAAAAPPFSSTARPAPQENYHAIMPPPKNQLFHHSFHPHQFHVYNKPPLTKRNGAVESDIGGVTAGNPSESIEAEKTESGSWNADSGGENGVKGTRVESNASFVSLHF